MLLNPNLEIFRGVPGGFKTPFASNDSRLSDKYQAIAKAAGDNGGFTTIGERLLCQQQADAWQSGLALMNFAKATIVGDLLADALPRVAWMSKEGPAGLFAKVAFPQSTDPKEFALALANAGVAIDLSSTGASRVTLGASRLRSSAWTNASYRRPRSSAAPTSVSLGRTVTTVTLAAHWRARVR